MEQKTKAQKSLSQEDLGTGDENKRTKHSESMKELALSEARKTNDRACLIVTDLYREAAINLSEKFLDKEIIFKDSVGSLLRRKIQNFAFETLEYDPIEREIVFYVYADQSSERYTSSPEAFVDNLGPQIVGELIRVILPQIVEWIETETEEQAQAETESQTAKKKITRLSGLLSQETKEIMLSL